MSCRRRFLSAPLSRRLRLHSPVSIFFLKKKTIRRDAIVQQISLAAAVASFWSGKGPTKPSGSCSLPKKKKRTSHAKHCLAVLASP
jgi:hypothetical protein